MEELIFGLIEQLPNLAVALAALWWCSRIISQMLDHQRTLIDRLLDMARRNEVLAQQITPPEQQKTAHQ